MFHASVLAVRTSKMHLRGVVVMRLCYLCADARSQNELVGDTNQKDGSLSNAITLLCTILLHLLSMRCPSILTLVMALPHIRICRTNQAKYSSKALLLTFADDSWVKIVTIVALVNPILSRKGRACTSPE
jgi:hypothetical protein